MITHKQQFLGNRFMLFYAFKMAVRFYCVSLRNTMGGFGDFWFGNFLVAKTSYRGTPLLGQVIFVVNVFVNYLN